MRLWHQAALALLPVAGREEWSLAQLGARREQVVAELMVLAMRVTRSDLMRAKLRNEADWLKLMDLLLNRYRNDVIRTLQSQGFEPSPSVLNGTLE